MLAVKAVKRANIDDGAISGTQLDNGVNTSLTNANNANNVTQIIYKTAVEGTTTMAAPSSWVTDTTGNQGVWTTKRPPYDTSATNPKVVCFTAIQSKNMSGTVTCTTPQIDDTTTIIDGGHIITNSITASKLAANAIQANMISGQLTDSQIAGLTASKLSGQINTGSIGWIKLSDGTFSLANGNFKYTNGSYIELYNNLSLRLNGIPLPGIDITNDITAAHRYIYFEYFKAIKTPYVVYVWLRGVIPTPEPLEQIEIVDLPTTVNTPDYIGVIFGAALNANSNTFSGVMKKNTNTEATLYANSGGGTFAASFSYYI